MFTLYNISNSFFFQKNNLTDNSAMDRKVNLLNLKEATGIHP